MTSQYLWLLVFGICFYIIITDESIASAFYYVIRLAKSYIQRKWWWLLHNPKNPVVKYLIYRRSLKMAEQLMSEINSKEETKD